MQEREISLIVLFWKIMEKWRILLTATLIGAVLLPCVQYAKGMTEYRQSEAEKAAHLSIEAQQEQLEAVLTQEQLQTVEDARNYSLLLKQDETYLKDAVLMQIDPYHAASCTLTYAVSTDTSAYLAAAALADSINQSEEASSFWGYSADELAKNHAEELVTAKITAQASTDVSLWTDAGEENTSSSDNVTTMTSLDNTASNGKQAALLCVQIDYTDEEKLADVVEEIKTWVLRKASELENAENTENLTSVANVGNAEESGIANYAENVIGKISLQLISETSTVGVDQDLLSKRQTVANRIVTNRNAYNSLIGSFTDEQTELLTALQEIDDATAEETLAQEADRAVELGYASYSTEPELNGDRAEEDADSTISGDSSANITDETEKNNAATDATSASSTTAASTSSTSSTADSGASEEEAVEKPQFSIKWVAVGAVAGLFVAAFIYALLFIYSAKLMSAEELREYFGLRDFGCLFLGADTYANGTKKFGTRIDAWIYRMQHRRQKMLPTEEAIDLAASSIALYCETQQVSRVFLTSSVDETAGMKKHTSFQKKDIGEKEQNIPNNNAGFFMRPYERLCEKLATAGIDVVTCMGNVCYSAESLTKAKEIGQVILVEQTGVSEYTKIADELRVLKDHGVEVLGCVGVE